ncbi:MAG: hypothetical protein ACJ74O_02045 [Frankiaceae bacterium]
MSTHSRPENAVLVNGTTGWTTSASWSRIWRPLSRSSSNWDLRGPDGIVIGLVEEPR